tara:strand:+ start:257 stop:616 length:360 start_codon:yes stop_codon:yes gene_type:complete
MPGDQLGRPAHVRLAKTGGSRRMHRPVKIDRLLKDPQGPVCGSKLLLMVFSAGIRHVVHTVAPRLASKNLQGGEPSLCLQTQMDNPKKSGALSRAAEVFWANSRQGVFLRSFHVENQAA